MVIVGIVVMGRGQHVHSDRSKAAQHHRQQALMHSVTFFHHDQDFIYFWQFVLQELFCGIGPDRLAFAHRMHQYALGNSVTGTPFVLLWITFGRYSSRHSRNTHRTCGVLEML